MPARLHDSRKASPPSRSSRGWPRSISSPAISARSRKEGTLLPDTYNFPRGTTREQVIQRMQQAHRRVLKEIWERRNADVPVKTPEALVTLASIVEKETGAPDERTRVAAVFANRLRQRMKLQSDPTIIYGLVGGKGTLGRPIMRSRDRAADALQHLCDRRPAAGPDRQSGPRVARGGRQSGAHQGTVLRRRRHRRPCVRREPTSSISRTSPSCASSSSRRAGPEPPPRPRDAFAASRSAAPTAPTAAGPRPRRNTRQQVSRAMSHANKPVLLRPS